jgi:HTH-type transcriptional regulator, competence development regulator
MTPFGMMLRQERKDKGMLLADMAMQLGISSPYLSQLETGAKPLKEAFVERVIKLFELNRGDADAMRRAAAKSLPASVDSVTIDLRPDLSLRDRELASNLALSFNRLKPETKARIRAMLKDESNG